MELVVTAMQARSDRTPPSSRRRRRTQIARRVRVGDVPASLRGRGRVWSDRTDSFCMCRPTLWGATGGPAGTSRASAGSHKKSDLSPEVERTASNEECRKTKLENYTTITNYTVQLIFNQNRKRNKWLNVIKIKGVKVGQECEGST
eukprot:570387-Prymnesium_polylepis.1